MNRSRATKRIIVRALSAGLLLAAFSGFTSPEQVTIVNPAGKTLSMMEVPGSLSVDVKVTVKSDSVDGMLVTMTKGEKSSNAQANSDGVASFPNIQAGTYTVASAASITDVSIMKRGNAPAEVSSNSQADDSSLAKSRSMYVVGASAVGGAVALLGSGSSNDGDSVERDGSASANLGGESDSGSTIDVRDANTVGSPASEGNTPTVTGTPSPAPGITDQGGVTTTQPLETPANGNPPVTTTPGPMSPS